MTRKPFFRPAAIVAACSLLILGTSTYAAKDFYKWEDENGVVHYSAHPPKDRPNTKVRTTNIYGEPAAEKDSKSAAEKAIEEKKIAAQPPKDPKRCASARKNLKTLQERSRVRIKEGEEYRFLNPEEIQAQIKTAKEIIKQEC